jgi:hypothetical protein
MGRNRWPLLVRAAMMLAGTVLIGFMAVTIVADVPLEDPPGGRRSWQLPPLPLLLVEIVARTTTPPVGGSLPPATGPAWGGPCGD